MASEQRHPKVTSPFYIGEAKNKNKINKNKIDRFLIRMNGNKKQKQKKWTV